MFFWPLDAERRTCTNPDTCIIVIWLGEGHVSRDIYNAINLKNDLKATSLEVVGAMGTNIFQWDCFQIIL